ncbi:3931_t:CDS:2, partial [Scutellospora calospora]
CRRSGHYAKEKDYMNNHYFYKRAYYLAILSAALQDKNSTLNVKVEFGAFDGDRHRSTILLKGQISKQQSTDSLPSTLQYNSAILKDMYCVSHLNLLYKNSKDCPAFNDACRLAKVWLYQRGIGGVNGGKKLANGYSSYRLIKRIFGFQTTLQGIQGLKSSPTIINSLKVIGGSPEFMNFKLLVSMLNPSNVKVVLDSDVKFDLLWKTNNVTIKGTTNSITLEPLREAFETLELTTVIPEKASIEIFNPLNTVIRFLMIDAKVTVKDELIGIINQKFVDAVNSDLKVNFTSNILISAGNNDGGFM